MTIAGQDYADRHHPHGGIYEAIPFGVWLCEPDGRLRYASDSFLELLGMSMDEASGFGWTNGVADEDRASVERWKECLTMEQDWDDEYQIRDPEGNLRTVIARGHAVRNASGEIEHWIGVHLDITNRKLAEQRVKDERNFAEAIIATTPVPLIVLDDEHRILTANPAFYKVFETTQKQTEGVLIHKLGSGQWDIPELHELLNEVLVENDSFDNYEVEHDFPDVGRKVMLVSGRRVQRKENHTELILLAIRDITEARQTEDRLRIIHETHAVQQERHRLAKHLHDDLQQLLIGAKMQVGIVRLGEADEAKKATLEKILSILDDSINASRDLAVELTPPVLFESGLMAALGWLAEWVREKHELEAELHIEKDVKLEDQHICLLLFESVRELLLNVVKHAGVGSAMIRAERSDRSLQIQVIDQGIGYQPDQIEKKGDLAAGFGLASVRLRVESVGGTIAVESGEGKGTTATIIVPLRQQ